MTAITDTLRINMWSGPRNVSTAMMYAWAQREDTTAVDEPLYAHYLHTTGRRHPGDADVLESQDNDGRRVVEGVLRGDYDTPVVFFKQMAKHLVDLDRSFLSDGPNILLTRDPLDMLTSLQVQLPDCTLADTGYVELSELCDAVSKRGERPIVIDSKALLQHPRRLLGELCEAVGVDFDEAMMRWPAGPKPEDGVWAPHWYHGVHGSTGWQPYTPKDVALLPHLRPVLDEATMLYEQLLPYQLR